MPVTIKMDSKEQEIERLEGRLKIAGGVCHEMKQPLMIISGHLELLLLKGQEDLELIDKINKINIQLQKLSELTANLMTLTQ